MSWNKQKNKVHDQQAMGKPRIVKGLVAGFLVFACSAILLYCNFNGHKVDPFENEATEKSKLVPEAKITLPKEKVQDGEIKEVELTKDGIPAKGLWTNEQGKVFFNGKHLSRSRRMEKPKPPYAIFNHVSENIIAHLLVVEPGTKFFGKQTYNEKFDQDFMKSCEEPIIVSKDDSDYVKQLKQAMINTKIELRDRMADGERVGAIIEQTRNEMQKLGIVKDEIERMVRKEARDNAKSAEEVDDLIIAANKLLEQKGIAPLKINPIMKQNLINRALRKMENEK